MGNTTLKVFVGFDEKEAVVFHTCVQSIIEHCKVPVSIHPLNLKMFQNYKETHSDGSNNFIYSRFLVPYLNNFQGKALFLDGDMIVNHNLNDLFDQFDEKYAVQVVKHDYKTKFPVKYLGHKNDDYPKKNWSSVILFYCSHPKNKILTPKYIKVNNNIKDLNYNKIKRYLGYPVVIKPISPAFNSFMSLGLGVKTPTFSTK